MRLIKQIVKNLHTQTELFDKEQQIEVQIWEYDPLLFSENQKHIDKINCQRPQYGAHNKINQQLRFATHGCNQKYKRKSDAYHQGSVHIFHLSSGPDIFRQGYSHFIPPKQIGLSFLHHM